MAALYAFAVLASAFLHHDVECHLTSRTHCTSCVFSHGTAGLVAARTPPPVAPPSHHEPVARRQHLIPASAPLFFGSDSSPPPAA